MYLCIHVCVCVFLYLSVYVFVCHMYVCIYVCIMRVCIYIYVYTYIYTYIHTHTHKGIEYLQNVVCKQCIYTYPHICQHICIHTNTYIHTYLPKSCSNILAYTFQSTFGVVAHARALIKPHMASFYHSKCSQSQGTEVGMLFRAQETDPKHPFPYHLYNKVSSAQKKQCIYTYVGTTCLQVS
jgi:hypothetical protein